MTYTESYNLLFWFDRLNPAYVHRLAAENKQTDIAFRHELEQRVYLIKNLTKRQRQFLLGRVTEMEEEEISVMERVNHLPFRDIYERLKGKE